MSLPAERCAPASERRGDQLFATAAPAERFVLLEEPGAWGRNALRDSRLNATVLGGLLARCHAANARLLLIRRAHRDPTPWRSWAIVDARPRSEAIWWGAFDDDAELAALDPARPQGVATTTPVFLVCTHGRRDACCAGRGWPVTVALTEAFPEQTWQCSHVGGDRFAANAVILPQGLYYGRLTPEDAVAVARRHVETRVTVESYRGRSCFMPAVQAAQHFARLRLGLDEIDTLHPVGIVPGEDGRYEVELAYGDAVATVVLARARIRADSAADVRGSYRDADAGMGAPRRGGHAPIAHYDGAMAPRITVVGSVNLDLVARVERLPKSGETVGGATFARVPGGKGANQAVACARLGADVTMIAAVGRDPLAEEALSGLRDAGVHLELQIADEPTGVALIQVDNAGETTISVASGANGALDASSYRRTTPSCVNSRCPTRRFLPPGSSASASSASTPHRPGRSPSMPT